MSKAGMKPRLKITVRNQTAYRTDDLRRFFRAGLRAMHAREDKTIEVKYRTGNRHICWATMGHVVNTTVIDNEGVTTMRPFKTVEGRWIRMVIGQPGTVVDMARFARVFEHEVLHNRGVAHREMTPHQRDCDQSLPEWAEGLEIRLKPEPVKLSREDRAIHLRVQREMHAREMLKLYEKKAKRTATLLKKWKTKVRYYERLAAKAAKATGEHNG
jgi:hypothetical protein